MSRKVKVMVLKMEVVKTVALNLDVEEMMGCSTVAMVKKRVLEKVADARVFAPNELPKLKFEMRDFLRVWREEMKKMEGEKKKVG